MNSKLEDWIGLDSYTLAEAALLIIEEYPDDWTDAEKLLKNPPSRFTPIYKKLRVSAIKVIDENAQSEEDARKTYIEYELHTDKAEKTDSISEKDGLSVSVGQGQLKKWIKAKNITARFFTDDGITEFKAAEKKLGSTERNTLLVIIGVLAKECKLDLKKPFKTAGLIAKMADEMGVSIDDETISQKLQLIPNAMERRSK